MCAADTTCRTAACVGATAVIFVGVMTTVLYGLQRPSRNSRLMAISIFTYVAIFFLSFWYSAAFTAGVRCRSSAGVALFAMANVQVVLVALTGFTGITEYFVEDERPLAPPPPSEFKLTFND